MRLLLLNQFGATSGAPTGRILAELGTELEKRGYQIELLTTDEQYGKPKRTSVRLLFDLWSHILLFWRSLWIPKVDAVISLTSPACLAVTAGIIAKIHRAQHFHWAMDVYPDVGARLGELRNKALVNLLSFLMRHAYRDAACIITLDEDMREYLQTKYGVDSKVIEPFPPEIAWPLVSKGPEATKRWLYSGNFGRAHEIQVLLQIQSKLEQNGVAAELVLQGQGPQFLSSRDSAQRLGLRQIQWRSPVPLSELGHSLLESDVLVITRKEEMKGLLLPSKLLLAELSGRSVLWIGDTDGKTALRLKSEKRHGVFGRQDIESIASWLQDVFNQGSKSAAIDPRATCDVRQESVRAWERLLPRAEF